MRFGIWMVIIIGFFVGGNGYTLCNVYLNVARMTKLAVLLWRAYTLSLLVFDTLVMFRLYTFIF